jgi:hypothetical protein
MNKFIWLVIFFVAVVIQAASTNFAYAFGSLTAWFIAGIVLSPVWWGITKKRRSAHHGNGLTGSTQAHTS